MNDPRLTSSPFSCVVLKDGRTCLFHDTDKVSTFVLANHEVIKSIHPSSTPMFGRTAESGRHPSREATNG